MCLWGMPCCRLSRTRLTPSHQGKYTGIDRDPGSTEDTTGGAEKMNVVMIVQDMVVRIEEETLSKNGDIEKDK